MQTTCATLLAAERCCLVYVDIRPGQALRAQVAVSLLYGLAGVGINPAGSAGPPPGRCVDSLWWVARWCLLFHASTAAPISGGVPRKVCCMLSIIASREDDPLCGLRP